MTLRINMDDVDNGTDDIIMYQGKKFTGILYELSYDGAGTLSYEREYVDGFPDGDYRSWWDQGKLEADFISPRKNNPCSRYAEWYVNGMLKELKESLHLSIIRHQKWDEQGVLIEEWETLNEDDWDIFSSKSSPIVNKKLHGTNTQWYDNGSIKEIHSYLKGKLVHHQKWDIDSTLVEDWEIETDELLQLQNLSLPND
jgi:antitoxin component YwqK of YwqJK toxin-antitoxin module